MDEQFTDFTKTQKPNETPNTDVISPDNNEEFDLADKNNDQQLTKEEAKVLPEVDTPEEFKLADENNDKLISFNEYKKALQENKIDPNETEKYNVSNNYYNVDNLEQNYDANVGQNDAEEQLSKYSPETEKDIWQEPVSDDDYKKLSNLSFDELSKNGSNINWKKLAEAVANGETSDKEKQKEWEDYISKVDTTANLLSKLSNNHIEKEEVEQILYRDYVKEHKEDTKQTEDKKPIQITEKTDVRERTIREAARHIMTHGKSLPKDLKKSVQETSAKFEPFKFEHKKSKTDDGIGNSNPLTYSDSDGLDVALGRAGGGENIPNGRVMQSGSGNGGGSISSDRSESSGVNVSGNKNTSTKAGGMSLPDLPEPKFSFGGGFGGGFDSIGKFNKKHPMKIKLPKNKKTKKVEFPDLSPNVEQHNETEGVPDVTKASRPIIKNGLYQDKSDKVDNDIFSNVIKDIIDKYKDWENVDEIYLKDIPQLNITLYYDGVSQPKIKARGMGGKQNISTLLRKEGGRNILENLYKLLEEEK